MQPPQQQGVEGPGLLVMFHESLDRNQESRKIAPSPSISFLTQASARAARNESIDLGRSCRVLTSSQELGLAVRLTKHFGRASGGGASSRLPLHVSICPSSRPETSLELGHKKHMLADPIRPNWSIRLTLKTSGSTPRTLFALVLQQNAQQRPRPAAPRRQQPAHWHRPRALE